MHLDTTVPSFSLGLSDVSKISVSLTSFTVKTLVIFSPLHLFTHYSQLFCSLSSLFLFTSLKPSSTSHLLLFSMSSVPHFPSLTQCFISCLPYIIPYLENTSKSMYHTITLLCFKSQLFSLSLMLYTWIFMLDILN